MSMGHTPRIKLRLLPGVHSVEIPSEQSTIRDLPEFPLRGFLPCDFSDCPARIELTGDPHESTTILLRSHGSASSSCVLKSDGAGRKMTPATKHASDYWVQKERGWIFLSFGVKASVYLTDLVFRTAFPASEFQNFIFLVQVSKFRMVRCLFPDLSTRASAVLIAPYRLANSSVHRRAYDRYQFIRCKFYISIASTDPPRLSNEWIKEAIKVLGPAQRQPPLGSFNVNVHRCIFHVDCDDASTLSLKNYNQTLSDSGFRPDVAGFAIEAFLTSLASQLIVYNCSFCSSSPSGRSCLYPASAVYIYIGVGKASIKSSTFVNLVSSKGLGSAIQIMGTGIGRGGGKILSGNPRRRLSLKTVTNIGRENVAKFGGAMLIYFEYDLPGNMNKIWLKDVIFRRCYAKFGAALFASTYKYANAQAGQKKSDSESPTRKTGRDIEEPAVFLDNVSVVDSFAQEQGGIFANQIGVMLSDGAVSGVRGTGVHLRNSLFTLTGKVEFVGNEAHSDGGAISTSAMSKIIFDNWGHCNFTFQDNYAAVRCGAVFIDRTSALLFDGDTLMKERSATSLTADGNACPFRFNDPTNLTDKRPMELLHRNTARKKMLKKD